MLKRAPARYYQMGLPTLLRAVLRVYIQIYIIVTFLHLELNKKKCRRDQKYMTNTILIFRSESSKSPQTKFWRKNYQMQQLH